MFPTDFYAYLASHTLIEIKGGTSRDTFTSIWMVAVGERVFARTWEKSERSWFTALLREGAGEIRYGATVIPIRGIKIERQPDLNEQINQAYKAKYTQPESLMYVNGITQPEYADCTVELVPASGGRAL